MWCIASLFSRNHNFSQKLLVVVERSNLLYYSKKEVILVQWNGHEGCTSDQQIKIRDTSHLPIIQVFKSEFTRN